MPGSKAYKMADQSACSFAGVYASCTDF